MLILHNLIRMNERGLFVSKVHLQLHSVLVLDHSPHNGIFDLPVMEVHADLVADFEFAPWLVLWHSKKYMPCAVAPKS